MGTLLLFGATSCKSVPHENAGTSALNEASPSQQQQGLLGLGMNDISVSFPREDKLKGIEAILPTVTSKPDPKKYAPGLPAAPEDGHGFVYEWSEQEHFDLAGIGLIEMTDEQIAKTGNRHLARTHKNMFNDYHLNGMRIVPCANYYDALGDDTKCVRTLQLTWSGPNDNTLHTIYRLSTDEFKTILQDVVAFHKNASFDTENLPLTVNPVILKEGLDSPYFKGMNGIIHRYARASKLIGIAGMHATEIGEIWQMGQAVIVNEHLVIPPPPPKSSLDSLDDRAVLTGEAQKLSSEFDDNPLVLARHQGTSFAQGLDYHKLGAESRKGLAVQNPRLTNITNVNCASCHTSGMDDPRNADGTPKADPLRFTSKHWNLAHGNGASMNDLANFSRGNVIQRVVNETAMSLNYLVEKGFLPKPANWDEPNTITQSDVDAPKIKIGASYRIQNPAEPGKACFGPQDGKKDAGTKIVGQECGNSPSQVYQFVGQLDNLTLVNQDSGLCLELEQGAPGYFTDAVCDKNNKAQFFSVTGNIYIARFKSAISNETSNERFCMESTWNEAGYPNIKPDQFSLFVSRCAVSTFSLEAVAAK